MKKPGVDAFKRELYPVRVLDNGGTANTIECSSPHQLLIERQTKGQRRQGILYIRGCEERRPESKDIGTKLKVYAYVVTHVDLGV